MVDLRIRVEYSGYIYPADTWAVKWCSGKHHHTLSAPIWILMSSHVTESVNVRVCVCWFVMINYRDIITESNGSIPFLCILLFSWRTVIPSYFSGVSAGVISNPSYPLIYFVWPLFLGFFSFFCLSLISSCGSPQWTLFTISLLHALTIDLSVLFYSSIFLESTCTSITLYVYLFALPSPRTCRSPLSLHPIFPFTSLQSPLPLGTVALPHERVISIA